MICSKSLLWDFRLRTIPMKLMGGGFLFNFHSYIWTNLFISSFFMLLIIYFSYYNSVDIFWKIKATYYYYLFFSIFKFVLLPAHFSSILLLYDFLLNAEYKRSELTQSNKYFPSGLAHSHWFEMVWNHIKMVNLNWFEMVWNHIEDGNLMCLCPFSLLPL